MNIDDSGYIFDEGFSKNAILVILNACAEDNGFTPPNGNKGDMIDRFVRAFNRSAPKNYTLNTTDATIEAPWCSELEEVENDTRDPREIIPDDESSFWKPTEEEIEDLFYETAENTLKTFWKK
jgi:hypothetical protein